MELIRKNWWILALQGIFLFIFGGLVLLEFATLEQVLIYLALTFIVFGSILFIWGLRSRKSGKNWWGFIFFGLVQAALGILILRYESEATLVFHNAIGSFAILIGLAQFILGLGRKANRLMFFANGLVSAVVGFLIVYDPFESEEAVPFLVALFSAILGIFIIYYSVRLRNYANAIAQQKQEKKNKAEKDKLKSEQQKQATEQESKRESDGEDKRTDQPKP